MIASSQWASGLSGKREINMMMVMMTTTMMMMMK